MVSFRQRKGLAVENDLDAVNRLLARMEERIGQARGSADAVERARIASALQWYAGWVLRGAVDECRDGGMSWPALGERLGVRQTTLFDQYGAGGPIIVARPHRSPGGRNDVWTQIWDTKGQAPLRQAATRLVQAVLTPAGGLPDGETSRRLYRPVHAMAQAQTAISSPEPLLRTVAEVLRVASKLADEHPRPVDERERAVWDLVAELGRVYQRDQEFVRVATDVAEIRSSSRI
jgi:hypothetical protein